jgi:phosphoribosylglycinamide formyltransferase 1
MPKKHRLAIFASGNGTNAEEIMRYFKGHPSIEVALVLSNKADAQVLERAKKFDISSIVFTKSQFRESDEVVDQLKKAGVSHVVLAGFLWLIPSNLVKAYPNKIVNIHPALLPKHGGKGMYGMKVHEAVKANGDTQTGITIHLVNDQYDDGEIIAQKSLPIDAADTPEDIARKVHQLEYKFYPEVIEWWVGT